MRIVNAEEVHGALEYPALIDDLERAFGGGFHMPKRQVMLLDEGGISHDAFALLPAWNDEMIALKAFTYFPENTAPYSSLYSKILLFDRAHGEPLALVDGTSVTWWRTAGVSALASRFLSRPDSETLLLLGTGRLAPYLVRAHASVRPLTRVMIWGRDSAKAAAVVAGLAAELPDISFSVATEIEPACGKADIIVAATGSPEILVRGEWVKPGTHTDFLGNHHADKRECDTGLIVKGRVYVDTSANCLKEAGELLVPIAEGTFRQEQLIGELADLCNGRVPGRLTADEITVFKSVGCALGDLTAAGSVWHRVNGNEKP